MTEDERLYYETHCMTCHVRFIVQAYHVMTGSPEEVDVSVRCPSCGKSSSSRTTNILYVRDTARHIGAALNNDE